MESYVQTSWLLEAVGFEKKNAPLLQARRKRAKNHHNTTNKVRYRMVPYLTLSRSVQKIHCSVPGIVLQLFLSSPA